MVVVVVEVVVVSVRPKGTSSTIRAWFSGAGPHAARETITAVSAAAESA
jgi:hypothetical protein